MIVSLFYTEDITAEEVEKLKQQDVLEVPSSLGKTADH